MGNRIISLYRKAVFIKRYLDKIYRNHLENQELRNKFNCYIDESCKITIDNKMNLLIGDNAYIASNVNIYVGDKNQNSPQAFLAIGVNTTIGEFSDVRAGGGRIEIGDNCLIAQHVSIIAANHTYSKDRLIRDNDWDIVKNHVTIEDDVWIGCQAVILPGVRIGQGAIVAAGAVVTKDVAPFTVVAGPPANFIKNRI